MGGMEYRAVPHGDERASVIGLGMGSIHAGTDDEIERTVARALEAGVNYFDLAPSEFRPFAPIGRALAARPRQDVLVQMHFGAVYETGPERKYGWTLDADRIARAFKEELEVLGLSYTDFGMVHCIDEERDFDQVMSCGTWDYLQRLKAQGTVRHIGASTHDPHIARLFLETGLVDLIMFSVNPAYDGTQGAYGIGTAATRAALYRDCEQAGVSMSVMKAFAGGQLLDATRSPLGRALTRNQLIQYALDRPAALTVLPGVRGLDDLEDVLAFLDATPAERDWSEATSLVPTNGEPACVYCNHCLPCPAGIDVGLVNKYYDLARAGDELARDHYAHLAVRAADCQACGHCESRCPFGVAQEARMEEIAAYFA